MPVYKRPAFYYIMGMSKGNEINKVMKTVDKITSICEVVFGIAFCAALASIAVWT